MTKTPAIESIIQEFVARLETAVRAEAGERVRAAVKAALGEESAPAKTAPAAPVMAKSDGSAGRQRSKLSPAATEARKLQGRYLGLLRGLSASARARVQKVAREQGVAAAIKFAAAG
jgi:hypothetical protein